MRSQAFDAVTASYSSEYGGNLYVTRTWVDHSCAKTSPYRAGSSNPPSQLNVGDWHRISKASRILLLKVFSSLAMTAALLSSNLWPVSLRCSPTAESVHLVVLECYLNRMLKGSGSFSNKLYRSFHNQDTLICR